MHLLQIQTSVLRVLAFAGLAVLASSTMLSAQTLTWSANTESNLAGYRVQYGTVSGSPSTTIDVGRVTSRQFTGLQAGVTYYFRVVAYNTAGQSSPPSAQVSYRVPSAPSPTSPTLTSVSPASGPTTGGTTITLTGTNFVSGATVRVGGVAATSVAVASSSRITARTPAGSAGARDVVVTNPDGRAATRSGGFTYVSPSTGGALTAAAVSPLSGPTSGGTTITVTGTGFVSGAAVLIGGSPATGVTVVSSTRLTALTPAKAAGGYPVQVRNPSGQMANTPRGFTYTGSSTPSPAPPPSTTLTAAAVSPLSGPTSGGTTVTVTGTGFVPGAAVLIGGSPATGVTVVSSTRLTARTPAKPAGGYPVQVRNPNGQMTNTPRGFTYSGSSTPAPAPSPSATPTATAVSPLSGPTSGGTLITVTGSNFVAGATVRIGGTAATGVTFVSSTRLTARTPAKTAGGYVVQVFNPNGQWDNTPRGFTYVQSGTTSATMSTSMTAQTLDTAEADGGHDRLAADASLTEAGADADADGLPTDWEARYGLDAASADGDDGAGGDPDGDGVTNDAELAAGSHPRGLIRRYLAEGIESGSVHTRLAVANPEDGEARVLLTFMRADGTTIRRPVDVPARSRRTIDLSTEADLAGASFSTVLESDRVVALDRLVAFDPAGRVTSVASAVDEPLATWSLPSASTAGSFELFYLVLNPGATDASVQVRYVLPDGAPPVERSHTVPAHSRATIWVDREAPSLAAAEVGAEITTADGTPIVVERTHYVTEAGSPVPRRAATEPGRAASSPVDGEAGPARRWLLAEGDLGGTTGTALAVSNRGPATDVTVTLLFEDGVEAAATFPAAAGARFEVPLGQAFPTAIGRPFSVLVEGVDPASDLRVDRGIARQADGRTQTAGGDGSGTRLP